MKIYTVEFIESDCVGFFSNKKKAIAFLREALKRNGETLGMIFPREVAAKKEKIAAISWGRKNEGEFVRYLKDLIDDDYYNAESILTLDREDIR